ncbi:MAG: hypothetical protein R3B07_19920 [Polyangiaceae bacterium]
MNGAYLSGSFVAEFGDAAIDQSVVSRLAAASEEQLAAWGDRVLDAQTLEELFS